jgi:hypothetical protein
MPSHLRFRLSHYLKQRVLFGVGFIYLRQTKLHMPCYCASIVWPLCLATMTSPMVWAARKVNRLDYSEIAQCLGISEATVRWTVFSAFRRLLRAGYTKEEIATVIRLNQLAMANELFIRCGSIECRPEKWVFYAQR